MEFISVPVELVGIEIDGAGLPAPARGLRLIGALSAMAVLYRPAWAYAAVVLSLLGSHFVGGRATPASVAVIVVSAVMAGNAGSWRGVVLLVSGTTALAIGAGDRAAQVVSAVAIGLGAGILSQLAGSRRERRLTQLREQAVNEERRRLALELHDVVAHHLTLMAVQAGAARMSLVGEEPDARAALHAVEDAGSAAVVQMQQLLTVLHRGRTRQDLSLVEDLATVIRAVRDVGVTVNVSGEAQIEGLGDSVQTSVLRIVQEGMTNVVRYAPGAEVHLTFRCLDGQLVLDMVDDGGKPSPGAVRGGTGHGLSGMAERIQHLGGHFNAGPQGVGFAIHAR
ncbi:MAG: hypothetical protein KY395_01870, partial [Actinobacteria bacterium]|nr:hypothetical protein [Actinomycetota bacterium]